MALSPVKILCVDDHQPTLHEWKQILQEQRFDVITANRGQTAYELACIHRPHLIVSDLDMPEIDGFELIARLKKTPATRRIPIVLCSGTTDQTSQSLALSLGAIAYLTKPLCASALVDIITERLAIEPLPA